MIGFFLLKMFLKIICLTPLSLETIQALLKNSLHIVKPRFHD